MIEAKCTLCLETFNPHSEEPDDLVHGIREDGTECGGLGTVTGEWVLHSSFPISHVKVIHGAQ